MALMEILKSPSNAVLDGSGFSEPILVFVYQIKITDGSLLAITLVSSLRTELRREIGMKSFAVSGLLTFGTGVMRELLMACRLRLLVQNSWQS
jgi:hypothetical protein